MILKFSSFRINFWFRFICYLNIPWIDLLNFSFIHNVDININSFNFVQNIEFSKKLIWKTMRRYARTSIHLKLFKKNNFFKDKTSLIEIPSSQSFFEHFKQMFRKPWLMNESRSYDNCTVLNEISYIIRRDSYFCFK